MHDSSEGSGYTQELIYSRHSHHQTLETLAAKALAEGDFAAAFQFADRRCRIAPPPLAHCYVLRAEAAYRLGDQAGALADLALALKISPQDTAALRRLLAWGNDADREQAALGLLQQDQDPGILRNSVEILAKAGRHRMAVASIYDAHVIGWAVWDSDQVAEICLSSDHGTFSQLLAPDPFHFLSRHPIRATAFRLPRSRSGAAQLLTISVQGERFFERRLPPNVPLPKMLMPETLIPEALLPNAPVPNARMPNEPTERSAAKSGPVDRPAAGTKREPDIPVTVIVPVYADHRATTACLDGLLSDNPSGKSYRIVVINDASPDPAISKYLKSLSRYSHVEILSNPVNLGFVGSVNRALARLPRGDVVLLNADTLVPPGFVSRLAGITQLSPEIGTVVPLSNNSEISDFPIPHHNNPLGTQDDVIRLDRIAASCNQGKAVDLPNGTGFCLYITRACLDAVGGLSESFHRGYLEDIDFCLRARERGFRNVCAPSVYVGHAGSRSFKAEKRALVLRNLGVLDYRFPRFRAETAAFVAADPLRPARQALERNSAPSRKRPTLIFSGKGALRAVAHHRARQLVLQGEAVIQLEVVKEEGARKIRFSAADQQSPQSLCIGFATDDDLSDLKQYLTMLRPSHCEIVDVVQLPASLLQTFASMKIPIDIWIADAALAPRQLPQRNPIMATNTSRDAFPQLATDALREISLGQLVTAARRLLVSTAMAAGFAAAALPASQAKLSHVAFEHLDGLDLVDLGSVNLDLADPGLSGLPTLVMVPTRSSAGEFAVIRQTADAMRRSRISIVIAGATLHDLQLMSLENIFVTGAIQPAELGRALQSYDVRWMLTDFDRPLFGHPLIEAVRASRTPVAYVDWSSGAGQLRPGDLAMAPEASAAQMAAVVRTWIEGA